MFSEALSPEERAGSTQKLTYDTQTLFRGLDPPINGWTRVATSTSGMVTQEPLQPLLQGGIRVLQVSPRDSQTLTPWMPGPRAAGLAGQGLTGMSDSRQSRGNDRYLRHLYNNQGLSPLFLQAQGCVRACAYVYVCAYMCVRASVCT